MRAHSLLRGKSSKEKNVRQRKDYHNKRGTCWSRVYVYIRLDDITLPLDHRVRQMDRKRTKPLR